MTQNTDNASACSVFDHKLKTNRKFDMMTAREKSQGITKVITLPPVGNMIMLMQD